MIRVAASDSRVASNVASLSSRRWRTAHGLLYVVARRCTPADARARFLKPKLLKRVGRHKDRRASLVFTCIACQEALDRFVACVVSLSRMYVHVACGMPAISAILALIPSQARVGGNAPCTVFLNLRVAL